MAGLGFGPGVLRCVLCVGAHCDDIELGCGGTLLRIRQAHPHANIHWLTLTSDPERRQESGRSAELFIGNAGSVQFESFRDGFLPYAGAAVKERFERLKRELTPDLIFTHARGDLHQDHRLVSELTWNTFRQQPILEYEIAKYDGDLGAPNVFVSLSEAELARKIEIIEHAYVSQRGRRWFDADTLRGVARLRGLEAPEPTTRFAEAFHARKLQLEL